MLQTRTDEWTDRVTDKFWPICQTANNKIQFSCKKFCTNSTGKLVYSDSGHTKQLTPASAWSRFSPLSTFETSASPTIAVCESQFQQLQSQSWSSLLMHNASKMLAMQRGRYQLFHLPTVQRVSALIYPFLSG